jgi:hypothetical protein
MSTWVPKSLIWKRLHAFQPDAASDPTSLDTVPDGRVGKIVKIGPECPVWQVAYALILRSSELL